MQSSDNTYQLQQHKKLNITGTMMDGSLDTKSAVFLATPMAAHVETKNNTAKCMISTTHSQSMCPMSSNPVEVISFSRMFGWNDYSLRDGKIDDSRALISMLHVLRRCIHWYDVVIKKLIFDDSVIFRYSTICWCKTWFSIVIVCSAFTRMVVNNKCHLFLSSDVGSSTHHLWDTIKGSRMSLSFCTTRMMMMMMMIMMMMMLHYPLYNNPKSWAVWFRMFSVQYVWK